MDKLKLIIKREILVERRRCLQIILDVCNRQEALAKENGGEDAMAVYEIESTILGIAATEIAGES